MKCPRCETSPLKAEEIAGQSVDICSDCQGVWIRRKDLERMIGEPGPTEAEGRSNRDKDRGFDRDDDDDDRTRGKEVDPQNQRKKKGGFFENITELFGGD